MVTVIYGAGLAQFQLYHSTKDYAVTNDAGRTLQDKEGMKKRDPLKRTSIGSMEVKDMNVTLEQQWSSLVSYSRSRALLTTPNFNPEERQHCGSDSL